MATEKDFQEEIEKCKDPVYFYENYLTVNGKPPPKLNDHQRQLLRGVDLTKKYLTLAPKNSGKSTGK